jgi:hypothetical protein
MADREEGILARLLELRRQLEQPGPALERQVHRFRRPDAEPLRHCENEQLDLRRTHRLALGGIRAGQRRRALGRIQTEQPALVESCAPAVREAARIDDLAGGGTQEILLERERDLRTVEPVVRLERPPEAALVASRRRALPTGSCSNSRIFENRSWSSSICRTVVGEVMVPVRIASPSPPRRSSSPAWSTSIR